MKRTILLATILLLCIAQEEQLIYLDETAVASLPTHKLIQTFATQQGEILRKVFTHYAENQIRQWDSSRISPEVISGKILDLVVGRSDNLYRELKKFVEEKLFTKLGNDLVR
jgi:hypothetical protein